MLNISTIVILYGSKLNDADTLNSLLNIDLQGVNLTVNIWNNGPKKLEKEDIQEYLLKIKDKQIAINIYEDCRNVALSKIYNFFIEKNNYDFISILDQDSILENDFYRNILQNKEYDMVCPAITIKANPSEQECPVYINICDSLKNKVKPSSTFTVSEIVTISSGLTISKRFVSNLKEQFDTVFNERFAFYHIDIELFAVRVKKCKEMKGICVGQMLHDITGRVEVKDMSPRVKLETGYRRILSRIYISETANKSFVSVLVYIIKKAIKDKYGFKNILKLIKCAIIRQHPRCKYIIESNKQPSYSSS